jgi:DNA-binding SARP family transcriptional activator
VRQLERAVRRNPELPNPPTAVEKAANVPPQPTLPLGGVGLVGAGAAAAARATLVSMLASGGPHHPHDQAEVIIDATTLATLVGADAIHLADWPRLHIADDTDAALLRLETEIVRRGRILSYHETNTLAELREQVPDEEALPPVLLISDAPAPASPALRHKVTAVLGGRLNVCILLLGEWKHGPTLDVATDGRTRLFGDWTGEYLLPDRMAVLEAVAAAQILVTVREAHTGKRPATEATAPPKTTPAALPAASTGGPTDDGMELQSPPTHPDAPVGDHAATSVPVKARLRVLGHPGIDDVTAPGRPLRAKALELAVFLACHPDGAATRDIGEHLAPDYTLTKADQQVHTNASNLRHVFARAGGPREDGYVLKMPGESTAPYRLDPHTVEVDLWQLRDLLRATTLASGERRRDLLATACGLYTGPLADGCDYEWITPYRETARRWGTEAHLLYAETLLDTDPQTAADVLDKAIRLDPYNEQLYLRALHARHALRDADGLRIIMRALTKALADIDAEPAEETIVVYQRLRASLDQR